MDTHETPTYPPIGKEKPVYCGNCYEHILYCECHLDRPTTPIKKIPESIRNNISEELARKIENMSNLPETENILDDANK